MDGRDRVLDHSLTLGDSISLRAVPQAADVHGVDGRDVPNRLDRVTRFAGDRILRMGHTCRPANAIVRIRSDATPTVSRDCIALGKAKADQECQPILQTILIEGASNDETKSRQIIRYRQTIRPTSRTSPAGTAERILVLLAPQQEMVHDTDHCPVAAPGPAGCVVGIGVNAFHICNLVIGLLCRLSEKTHRNHDPTSLAPS